MFDTGALQLLQSTHSRFSRVVNDENLCEALSTVCEAFDCAACLQGGSESQTNTVWMSNKSLVLTPDQPAISSSMSGLFSSLLLQLEGLLYRRSRRDSLVPCMARRRFRLPIVTFVSRQPRNDRKPRHEHQIRIAGLVAHQILVPRLFEVDVDYSNHTLDLVAIAIFGRRNLFVRVEESKPGFLSEVRSLAGHLELRPTFLLVLLRELGVC